MKTKTWEKGAALALPLSLVVPLVLEQLGGHYDDQRDQAEDLQVNLGQGRVVDEGRVVQEAVRHELVQEGRP